MKSYFKKEKPSDNAHYTYFILIIVNLNLEIAMCEHICVDIALTFKQAS